MERLRYIRTFVVASLALLSLAASAPSLRAQIGGFAYVANSGSNTVSAYSIDAATGALSAVAGSPFVGVSAPASVTVDPSHRFVYVANSDASISVFAIDGATGALAPITGSPFPARVT